MRIKILAFVAVSLFMVLIPAPVLGQSPIRYVSTTNVIDGTAVGSVGNLKEEDTKRVTITEEDLYPDTGDPFDTAVEGLPLDFNDSFGASNYNVILGCDYGQTHVCLQEPSWQPDNQLRYVGWYFDAASGPFQIQYQAAYDMYNISGLAQAAAGNSYVAATWRSQYWRNLIEPIPPARYIQFFWTAEDWVNSVSVSCVASNTIQLMNFSWHTEYYPYFTNCAGPNFRNHVASFTIYCSFPFPNSCTDSPVGIDAFLHVTQITIGVGNNLQDFSLNANFDIDLPENAALNQLSLVCDTDVSTVYTLSILRDTTPRSLGAACDTMAVQTFTLEPTDARSDGKIRFAITDSSSSLSADLVLDMMRITINVTADEFFVSGDSMGFIIVFLFISSGIMFAAWVIYKYRGSGGL